MADLAQDITVDMANMSITIDGHPFPVHFSEVGLDMADLGGGEMVSAIKIIVPTASLIVLSKRTTGGAE